MASEKENLKRIAAYLAGQLTPAEQSDFEQWLSAATTNESLFHETARIWESSGKKFYLQESETLLQWAALKAKMEEIEKKGKVVSIHNYRTLVLRIAASVIMLVVVFYVFVWLNQKEIIISSGDEVATFYLPDSSRVWLNTNSKLTYGKDFGKDNRMMKLEGEGYFKVIPDKTVTFTVTTQNTITQVVGTSFNIKENPEEVVLTVSEGTVKFSPADSPGNQSVTVNAREKASRKSKGKIQKSKDTEPNVATWRELNNPEFEREKDNPQEYLKNTFVWRKNQINQSVIEGTLSNSATLATYKNIVLKVTYTKPNGKASTVRVKISDAVKAGEMIRYQKRLFDILTDTQTLKVEVEAAETTSSF